MVTYVLCRRQGGPATAFDLAAFWLSMIAPVKKSVNHSRTVASMRETGQEQQLACVQTSPISFVARGKETSA